MYQVTVGESIRRSLRKLSVKLRERLLRAVYELEAGPRPPGCTKLTGQHDLYRIRVGDYRIVYRVNDERQLIEIVIIAHRREVYRDL
ncbi:MAG: type II toxin-antitoxin system RelE/ParE family toxin [Tepidisphaeraceae bacterium]